MDLTMIGQEDYRYQLLKISEQHADKLFPNSPIEIVVDFTDRENRQTKDNERSWHFTFYCEGEWIANELTCKGAIARIRETIKVNLECWATPRCYINPDWDKWSQIQLADLYRLIGLA